MIKLINDENDETDENKLCLFFIPITKHKGNTFKEIKVWIIPWPEFPMKWH